MSFDRNGESETSGSGFMIRQKDPSGLHMKLFLKHKSFFVQPPTFQARRFSRFLAPNVKCKCRYLGTGCCFFPLLLLFPLSFGALRSGAPAPQPAGDTLCCHSRPSPPPPSASRRHLQHKSPLLAAQKGVYICGSCLLPKLRRPEAQNVYAKMSSK